ncbi:MAG: 2-oxoglutarate and iron-dependent oxygenase domain-containing protein, partial [Actinomycetota bacterium]|nr:2-oxoglutarate and iron-dependent oxygenase domain-containing protein [Actinomycetota bacterium]
MSRRMLGVPVVELGDTTGLVSALSDVGFVAVRGHGVPDADRLAMRRLLVDLFAVDEDAKRRQAISRDDYRGFIPLRFFSPNRAGMDPTDAFEGYKLHWECPPDHPVRSECALYGSNRWATHLPEMAAVVGSWWTAMDALACRLVDGLAD